MNRKCFKSFNNVQPIITLITKIVSFWGSSNWTPLGDSQQIRVRSQSEPLEFVVKIDRNDDSRLKIHKNVWWPGCPGPSGKDYRECPSDVIDSSTQLDVCL